jgi:hypothetical protein
MTLFILHTPLQSQRDSLENIDKNVHSGRL